MPIYHVPDAHQQVPASIGESKGKRGVGIAQRGTLEMSILQVLLRRRDQATNSGESSRVH
jgi:hypothetical protein